MQRRSKVVGFLLNVFPGLGLSYMGHSAGGYFIALAAIGLLCVFLMTVMGYRHHVEGLLVSGYFLLWIFSESVLLFGTVSVEVKPERETDRAALLAFVPGLGHMYLGRMEEGLILFSAFLLGFFLSGWLGSALFLFLLPILVVYSIFDIKKLMEGNADVVTARLGMKPWMGYVLIGVGVFILLEKVLFVYLSAYWVRHVKTVILALAFVAGGMFILKKGYFPEDSEKIPPIEEDPTEEKVSAHEE